MLEAEMESSLGYAKHGMKNKQTTNSRNGYSKKLSVPSMARWTVKSHVIVRENLNLPF
jgi:transposase-like protein